MRHRIGFLDPEGEEGGPQYAQLYIFDEDNATFCRMRQAISTTILPDLRDMARRRNPFPDLFPD